MHDEGSDRKKTCVYHEGYGTRKPKQDPFQLDRRARIADINHNTNNDFEKVLLQVSRTCSLGVLRVDPVHRHQGRLVLLRGN